MPHTPALPPLPEPGSEAYRELDERRSLGAEGGLGHELIEAAEEGSLALARELLAQGASPLAMGYCDCTALMSACRGDQLEIALALIEAGADIHALNGNGHAALHVAAMSGSERCLQELLRRGAQINQRGAPYGETPLGVAARKGSERIARVLIEAGAALEVADAHGRSPLFNAIESDNAPLAIALIQSGAATLFHNEGGPPASLSALGLACSRARPKCVQALLELGADPNQGSPWTPTPLAWALASNGAILAAECVRALIAAGADIELASPAPPEVQKPEPPLVLCAVFNQHAAALALLEAGANPTRLSSTGLSPDQVALDRYDGGPLAAALSDARRARSESQTLSSAISPPSTNLPGPRL